MRGPRAQLSVSPLFGSILDRKLKRARQSMQMSLLATNSVVAGPRERIGSCAALGTGANIFDFSIDAMCAGGSHSGGVN